MPQIALSEIYAITFNALISCGATQQQAKSAADSITMAEAEGLRNVGWRYLPVYLDHLLCGKINGAAVPQIRHNNGATLSVDANNGFSHTAFDVAIEEFVTAARQYGIAQLAIKHSYSAGVLGWFNRKLAEQGLLSLAFANSSAMVAPWGGRSPLFGTNPIGFGAPRKDGPPLIIDMATTNTARVNVLAAAEKGEQLPFGWIKDKKGALSADPADAEEGTLTPLGAPHSGAKGYGLMLMVEIMAAGLSGGSWSFQSSSFLDNSGGPPDVGQLFIAIQPQDVQFAARFEQLASQTLSEDDVRLPGQRRHKNALRAKRQGVMVPQSLYNTITAYL